MPSEAHFDYMDAVEAALTQKVLLRVTRFAQGRCKLLHTWGLPGDAEALAHDAINDTFVGSRRWDPDQCPLHQHLQGIIRSRVSHAFRHHTLANYHSIGVHYDKNGYDAVEVAATEASEPVSTAEEQLIHHDLARQTVAAMVELARSSNDNQVIQMIDAWQDGVTERQEVAERLGISTKKVKHARERLLRLANKLPEPLRDGRPRND